MGPSSVTVFLLSGIIFLLSSVSARQLEFVYSVQYQDGRINISVQSTDPLRSNQVPDLENLSVSPLITIATCTPSTPSQDGLLPTAHTLLTTSHFTHSSSGGPPTLSLLVPNYLEAVQCLEVAVTTLLLGAGLTVPAYREKFTHERERRNESELFCSTNNCEIVDSHWMAWTAVSLLRHTITGEYSLVNYIINSITSNGTITSHPLPGCLDSQASRVIAWRTVIANRTCVESFTPTNVYLTSQREVFVTGNGLLYSPDYGFSFYQLVTPDYSDGLVLSFAISPVGQMFAAILSQNVSTFLWFGWAGGLAVRLLPSALLDHLLGTHLFNLAASTLTFNNAGKLFLDLNSTLVEVPVMLLLSEASSTATHLHTHNVIRPHIHTLTTNSCPYQDVVIAAPVCGQVTRTQYHVESVGVLRWTNLKISGTNCSVMEDRVPREIFLGRLESYEFRVEFMLQPTFTDPTKLLYTALLTPDSGRVGVALTPSYHPLTHRTHYTIVVSETGSQDNQWRPGTVAMTTDLTLKVWGAVTDCMDSLSPPITPDFIETTLHVGCPPGLSLTFDPESSHAHFEQYCENSGNISCYFYRNEFWPVFRLVDEVTEGDSVYTGPYTLRVVAGGVSLEDMTHFQFSQQIERSIWSPVNISKLGTSTPVYYHGDSGIMWMCGMASPCSEIIPWDSLASEYYLLIEASNRIVGERSSYCDLSDQFLIRVHGLSMGAVTTIVSLVVFLTTLGVLSQTLFLCWLYRDRLAQCKSSCLVCRRQRRWLENVWTRLHQS